MSKTSRIPKDAKNYITPWLAAIRLANIALDYIACKPRGVRVKWTLKINYYYPQEVLNKSTAVAVAMGGTLSSGEEVPELTGNPVLEGAAQ